MANGISSVSGSKTPSPIPAGAHISEGEAKAYLAARSMNDLVRNGTRITWDQLPEGSLKYGDYGDVPADHTVTYIRTAPYNGEVMYAAIADSASWGLGYVALASYEGQILAYGESKGRGRWNRTLLAE